MSATYSKWTAQAMCGNKVKHPTREHAMITLNKMGAKKKENLHPYKCPLCHSWHNGGRKDKR